MVLKNALAVHSSAPRFDFCTAEKRSFSHFPSTSTNITKFDFFALLTSAPFHTFPNTSTKKIINFVELDVGFPMVISKMRKDASVLRNRDLKMKIVELVVGFPVVVSKMCKDA